MKLLVKMKNVSFILRKKIIWTFGFLAHRLWVTASLCILTRKVVTPTGPSMTLQLSSSKQQNCPNHKTFQ